MRQENQPERQKEGIGESAFSVPEFDPDSPLRTESLFAGEAETFFYATSLTSLLLAEEKERGQWGKGRGETEAERAARIEAQRAKTEETHQKVEAGIEALAASLAEGKSDLFLALLEAFSRFHRYSWGNTLLILLQRPDATIVAGFTTWKEAGRYVKSGEKGICILAPIPKRLQIEEESKDQDAQAGTTTTKTITGRSVWGFKVVYVFDVSQTDGKPLPQLPSVRGDPAHYLERIKAQVQKAGITLEYADDLGGARGRSWGGRIQIKNGLTPAQEFSTLVHEFAHERLHTERGENKVPERVRETEAEAVAYIVNRAIGLEPGTASSDYIQLYRGNTQTLIASLERIQQTATHILTDLEEGEGDLRSTVLS